MTRLTDHASFPQDDAESLERNFEGSTLFHLQVFSLALVFLHILPSLLASWHEFNLQIAASRHKVETSCAASYVRYNPHGTDNIRNHPMCHGQKRINENGYVSFVPCCVQTHTN